MTSVSPKTPKTTYVQQKSGLQLDEAKKKSALSAAQQGIRGGILPKAVLGKKNNEFDYTLDELFYLYAYPEHNFVNQDFDMAAFQDLYDAGYSDGVINFLLEKLKEKTNNTKKPPNTKIIVLSLIVWDNESNTVNKLIKPIKDLYEDFSKDPKNKLVVLAILKIQEHAHALVIHLSQNNVYMMLKDPYGKSVTFERKAAEIFNLLQKNIEAFFKHKETQFHAINTPEDLQGFAYDYSNCAPLSLYSIEKYLNFALLNESPERYMIKKSFDDLPWPKLNISLHKAFILRLKVKQLISIPEGQNYQLGFQSASATNYIDIVRQNNAKANVKKLLARIRETAVNKYKDFIPSERHPFISRLSIEQAVNLLNIISEIIISNKVRNIIEPQTFTVFLESIFENFLKSIEFQTEEEKKIFRAMEKQTQLFLRELFSRLCGNSTDMQDEQLWDAIIQNNIDKFKYLLQQAKKQSKSNCIILINKLLRKYLTRQQFYPEFQTQHKCIMEEKETFKPAAAIIIETLLAEGADPFSKEIIRVTDDSSARNVVLGDCAVAMATKLSPILSLTICQVFPNALHMTIQTAATVGNIDLLNCILQDATRVISRDILETASKNADDSLPKETSIFSRVDSLLLKDVRDPAQFERMRTAKDKISKTKEIINEKIRSQGEKAITILINPYVELIQAVNDKNILKIKRLISDPNKIKNINMLNEEGVNALGIAMKYKHEEIAIYLLSQGAALDCFNHGVGFTPLELAFLTNDPHFLDGVLLNQPPLINFNFDEMLLFAHRRKLNESIKWISIQRDMIRQQDLKETAAIQVTHKKKRRIEKGDLDTVKSERSDHVSTSQLNTGHGLFNSSGLKRKAIAATLAVPTPPIGRSVAPRLYSEDDGAAADTFATAAMEEEALPGAPITSVGHSNLR